MGRMGRAFCLLWVSLASAGCERGCGWIWLREHGVGEGPALRGPSASLSHGLDCPDGLARCAGGTVDATRLARIAEPCRGPESACTCPWERIAACAHGCVVEGLEVAVERRLAAAQLCAPEPGSKAWTASKGPVVAPDTAPASPCDEGQLYRCAGALVTDCATHAVGASCARGCFAEGAVIEDGSQDEPITREAAFAILCSR